MRCGRGETVAARVAVAAAFTAVLGRYEDLLPRESIRRILTQLRTFLLSMAKFGAVGKPPRGRSVESGHQRPWLEAAGAAAIKQGDEPLRCEGCAAACEPADYRGAATTGCSDTAEATPTCSTCGRRLGRASEPAGRAVESEEEARQRVAYMIQGTLEALMAHVCCKLEQLKLVRCPANTQSTQPDSNACIVPRSDVITLAICCMYASAWFPMYCSPPSQLPLGASTTMLALYCGKYTRQTLM